MRVRSVLTVRRALVCALMFGAVGCDVGRSVFAPLDATVTDDAAGDVTGADTPGADTPGADAPAGSRTCADFVGCAQNCAGSGFPDCLMTCAQNIRPASRVLVDDLLTCVRRTCSAGLTDTCAGMAVTGPCAPQLGACGMDGARPDAGPTDATTDATIDAAPSDAAPTDAAPSDAAPSDAAPSDAAPSDAAPSDAAPSDAATTCGVGLSNCGGSCVNVLTSNAHCGACGNACPTGQTCTAGSCVGTAGGACAAPQTMCGTDCVDTRSNRSHCGMCNNACAAGQVCAQGVCVCDGPLRFTLAWDNPGDVDLHVVPPCGTDIFFERSGMNVCGGTLDHDDTRNRGPENVCFTNAAMTTPGTYLICIVPYALGAGTTNATVTVWEGSAIRRTFSRPYTSSDPSRACSRTSPYFVGEYNYRGTP